MRIFNNGTISKVISALIAFVFIWTNCIYAAGAFPSRHNVFIDSYKIAASTGIKKVGLLTRKIQIPLEVLRQIKIRKIADLKGLRLNIDEIKSAIIDIYERKMNDKEIVEAEFERLKKCIQDSYPFISSDKKGTAVVIYLCSEGLPYIYRLVPTGVKIKDEFFNAFLSKGARLMDTLPINGVTLGVYANPDNVEGINRALSKLYGKDIKLKSGGIVNGDNDREFYRVADGLSEEAESSGRLGVEAVTDLPPESGGQLTEEHVSSFSIGMSFHVGMLLPYYIMILEVFLSAFGIWHFTMPTAGMLGLELIIGFVLTVLTFWITIGWHERGHYLEAVRQTALNKKLLKDAEKRYEKAQKSFWSKLAWDLEMLWKIPRGTFPGVIRTQHEKEGLKRFLFVSYKVDAPSHPDVNAAGPIASGKLSKFAKPFAVVFLVAGFITGNIALQFIGRLLAGVAFVSWIDSIKADKGAVAELERIRRTQAEAAAKVEERMREANIDKWVNRASEVRRKMINERIEKVKNSVGKWLWAPWGFRNSGMGGRHTEKEYRDSNISMQETMFVPLSAKNYEEAQEMTVKLQLTLKSIIDSAEGCRVMGIGLEGGLAAYIRMEAGDLVPEQRLWRMAKEAIKKSGYVPGVDVALALDPAASELEKAYNQHKYNDENITPDDERWEIGKYLFWRMDGDPVELSSDQLLELYRKAIEDDDIPIVSIEDGFAEDDNRGWSLIMDKYGDKFDDEGNVTEYGSLFVIGDDFVTTNDKTIDTKAEWRDRDGKRKKLTNATLIKANQIGTLSETMLAMLTSLGKGLALVISHRSKSPNDDMEAQLALAAFAVGLKAGGGANTERLFKYGAIVKALKEALIDDAESNGESIPKNEELEKRAVDLFKDLVITQVLAFEEPTNAGIPTVGVEIHLGVPNSRFRKIIISTGATPLGTSAGTGEAIHLVDAMIQPTNLLVHQYKAQGFFVEQADGTYKFNKEMKDIIFATRDPLLTDLWRQAVERYDGKGNLEAVKNVQRIAKRVLIGKKLSDLGDLTKIDQTLMALEIEEAQKNGHLAADADMEIKIAFMQRKGNLGMNTILSLSLALARLIGKADGKDLWEIIREKMEETMAKAILAYGSINLLEPEAKAKVRPLLQGWRDVREWQVLAKNLDFHTLVKALQNLDRHRPEGKALYQILREQLPVYDVSGITLPPAPVSTPAETAAGPISKVTRRGNQVDIWEADIQDGQLVDARVPDKVKSEGNQPQNLEELLQDVKVIYYPASYFDTVSIQELITNSPQLGTIIFQDKRFNFMDDVDAALRGGDVDPFRAYYYAAALINGANNVRVHNMGDHNVEIQFEIDIKGQVRTVSIFFFDGSFNERKGTSKAIKEIIGNRPKLMVVKKFPWDQVNKMRQDGIKIAAGVISETSEGDVIMYQGTHLPTMGTKPEMFGLEEIKIRGRWTIYRVNNRRGLDWHELYRRMESGELQKGTVERKKFSSVEEEIQAVEEDVLQRFTGKLREKYMGDMHHGLKHARDLLETAKELSNILGVQDKIDWSVLALAVFLHDIFADQAEAHEQLAANYIDYYYLGSSRFTSEQLFKVINAILLHNDRTTEGAKRRQEAGIEAQILYDIDQLDAFGYKGIYRYLAVYFQRGKDLEYINSTILEDVEKRFESLMFDRLKEIGRKDYDITKEFFKKLRAGDREAVLFAELIRENLLLSPAEIAEKGLRTAGKGQEYLISLLNMLEEIGQSSIPQSAQGVDTQSMLLEIEDVRDMPEYSGIVGKERGTGVDEELLKKVIQALGKVYGPGILSGVDVIRVVDNLKEGQVDGKVPYTSIISEGKKRVMLIDVDSFDNEDLLFLVVEHELIEGIMTLLPYDSEAIRELASNYISIQSALERGVQEIPNVASLDPDSQFLQVIKYIRVKSITEEKDIIALLIEHMRMTPYYKDLFREFSFAKDWEKEVGGAEDRFKAAIDVFNEISSAARIVQHVKRTEKVFLGTTERFNRMISKMKMIVSVLMSEEIGLVEALLDKGKYIRLDIDDLDTNPDLLGWIRQLTDKKQFSPFIYYSGTGRDVTKFLADNNLSQTEVKGDIKQADTITLIAPEKVNNKLPEDTLYLSLPYTRSTLYLAYEVVLAGGAVASIDPLARNTIKSVYEVILGREIKDSELGELFRRPWIILPPITKDSKILNAISAAIRNIESAA